MVQLTGVGSPVSEILSRDEQSFVDEWIQNIRAKTRSSASISEADLKKQCLSFSMHFVMVSIAMAPAIPATLAGRSCGICSRRFPEAGPCRDSRPRKPPRSSSRSRSRCFGDSEKRFAMLGHSPIKYGGRRNSSTPLGFIQPKLSCRRART